MRRPRPSGRWRWRSARQRARRSGPPADGAAAAAASVTCAFDGPSIRSSGVQQLKCSRLGRRARQQTCASRSHAAARSHSGSQPVSSSVQQSFQRGAEAMQAPGALRACRRGKVAASRCARDPAATRRPQAQPAPGPSSHHCRSRYSSTLAPGGMRSTGSPRSHCLCTRVRCGKWQQQQPAGG